MKALISGHHPAPLQAGLSGTSSSLDRHAQDDRRAFRGGPTIPAPGWHDVRGDPLSVEAERVAAGSLQDETGLLVHVSRPRIQGEHLELDAMQAELLERVSQDEPRGLRAEPAIAPFWSDQSAVADAAGVRIPVLQHHLAHDLTRRVVEDGEVEAVTLVTPCAIPLEERVQRQLYGGAAVVGAAGQPDDVRVSQDPPEGFGIISLTGRRVNREPVRVGLWERSAIRAPRSWEDLPSVYPDLGFRRKGA
uniref:Uncharacterized protein n=1 Tax=uncultured Nocardioidaceae bacterium TaxID=253824 RepID=A0A6J4KXN1_9ACTN|nr:MAG: hypothetical protein AVDCRST_MAG46-566 [uncultured Nocardioidaceae bacterium]